SQRASTTTGDGVAGEVTGAVTSAGGSASIVAANRSVDSSVETGDGHATNDQEAFVGLNRTFSGDVSLGAADFTDSCRSAGTGCNAAQDGDDLATMSQNASASTGDGVAGEVIGAVTSAGGSASIVAANHSTNSDVETGDGNASNDLTAFVGLNRVSDGA